jgi:glycerate 2-kinase
MSQPASMPATLPISPNEERLAALRSDAIEIFEKALADCDIDRAFERHLQFDGKTMRRQLSPVLPPVEQSLEGIKRVQVIAFGKAAIPMLDALLARLPEKLRVDGICSSPEPTATPHKRIRYYQGSHPLPNEDSVAAAKAALDLLRKSGKETLVFFLISGGGSAALELPRDPAIPLDDVRAFYEALVLCGADIGEINTVRKHFSAVKGGRLGGAAPLAQKLTLLLADVPMKDIGVVASSPTLPDCSTWNDCAAVLERWQLLPRFPATVRAYFARLAQAQGLAAKPVSTVEKTQVDVLLSNHDFVNAARDQARAMGYKVVIDNTPDNWPYERASAYLLEQMAFLKKEHKRVCLLSSGEVTVAIAAGQQPGCGGRNQQFTLDSAIRMDGDATPMVVLSAGSDGIDGNSPAAGAIADPTTAARARRFQFDPVQALHRYNTCPLFTALGDAIITGPTGNNLRDLRVLLAES